MNERPTTLERAYQLARSGECANVTQIKKRLRKEGYEAYREQLTGTTILRELHRLCVAARAAD